MAMSKHGVWTVFLASLLACGEPSADRFETVTKLKILAVRAESPELHPGETTRVDVLMAAPDKVDVTTFMQPFSAAVVQDFGRGEAQLVGAGMAYQDITETTFPCPPIPNAHPRCLPFDLTPTGLEKPGVASLYYEAPATTGAFFVAVGAREGVLTLSPDMDLAEETRRALKAIKEIRVRPEGETLNRNPEVLGAEVTQRWRLERPEALRPDEYPLPVSDMTLGKGEMVRLALRFTDEEEERVSATWWISAGDVRGFGRTDMDYVAPERAGMVTVIGLLLDRQGGNNWWIQDLAVAPDEMEPDISANHALLVRSAGRIFWLGFAEASTAASVAAAVRDQEEALVEGDLTAHPTARLGWNLANPVLVGAPDATTETTAVADVGQVSASPERVRMRIDAVIREAVE